MTEDIKQIYRDTQEALEEYYEDSGLGKCEECKKEIELMKRISEDEK
jgi:hypothetical protein